MVNEHNQDSDVSPLLQRGPGRRSGCIRGERGGTKREMLWGNTRLCIWRKQLFTPRKEQKTMAGLRHAPGHTTLDSPGHIALGCFWDPLLWLVPPQPFP